MAAKKQALEAIRDILLTAVNTEPNAQPIQGGWVYAHEYRDVVSKFLPIIIVDKIDGIPNQRGVHGQNRSYDRWRASVILYLYYGDMEHPSSEGAEATGSEEGWVDAISRALLDNLTLNDTVVKIGEPDNKDLKVFDYQSDYWQWDGEPYWGIRFEIPIMQWIEEDVSV